jgi:8-oxo-dGTP pyrophosphatase MutT (NUDIX family)
MDESLEEGAIRETFEEAGVLGILGPSFDSFVVESSKAKKKRMNIEKEKDPHHNALDESSSIASSSCSDFRTDSYVKFCDLNTLVPMTYASETSSNGDPVSVPDHTHTCMTFFPLYVQHIADSWPENTRERRAYPIDGKLWIKQKRMDCYHNKK